MKVSKPTLEAMAGNMRTYLAARFPAILDAIRLAPDKVSEAEMWTIWHHVTDEIRFDDTHGRFAGRTRVFPQEFNYPLYPDDTNDTTLGTALRAALKLL